MQKLIFCLFGLLFFVTPLVLWPYTSEVFEFNKIVLVYTLTIIILSAWLVRMVLTSKIIFRRSILDIPLLFFIGSQLISTILSIDPLTSWLGYYSRFNGGLISTICYSLLYWAFVSNLDRKHALYSIYYLLASSVLVCLYAVLEHFGIDKNIWVQDVQSRVFSTLGQPNWLAAWIVALSPLAWASAIASYHFPVSIELSRSKFIKFLIYFSLSVLFFITLLFTKSRSGLLGFLVAYVIFWGRYFWTNHKKITKEILFPFVICNLLFVIFALVIGTQFTPSISQIISHQDSSFHTDSVFTIPDSSPKGPALDVGGTESGTIRKIVWKGAIEVWKHYPVFGTGPETFAYSYPKFRPKEHNLVSEWDFIYNKAHNEFLNIAANSGSLGLLSYLILIGFSIFIFIQNLKLPISNLQSPIKPKSQNSKIENSKLIGNWQPETGNLNLALLAGYISLLVTNFFGFSVVPTQLELFLFPALAVVCSMQNVEWKNKNEINTNQKILISIVLLSTCYLLLVISHYWSADYHYSLAKAYNGQGRFDLGVTYLSKAISLQPSQALYHNELAATYISLALSDKNRPVNEIEKYIDSGLAESKKAISLSPANVNLRKSMFSVLIRLSVLNPNYLIPAENTLAEAIKIAPTDAKLYYNLGLVYARMGNTDMALSILQKTIELKSNYKDARLAYALLLIDKKDFAKAKVELEYILSKIDPNDSLTKQTLEGI